MKIAVIGDYRPDAETHQSTNRVLSNPVWIPTEQVTDAALAAFDALWIAPGSPYRSLEGALAAIRYGREHGIPTVGCCGGCQHMVLEFARNVLGIADAVHPEYNPDGGTHVMTPFTCLIAGKTMEVKLREGSLAARAYGRATAVEKYYCNYGVNPEYQGLIDRRGLHVTGTDEAGEPRVIELEGHPFFLGVLFVPETAPHPIVSLLQQKVADKQCVNS
jgi:CTP synthase (UTP-ammonia lyase)